MPEYNIVVKGINKSFGSVQVIKNISLTLFEGKIFGLLGPNAAGKSTLTKIMVGELKADSGQIFYYGQELFSNRNLINKIIAVVPQEEYFYRDFSVEKNLGFCGMLYGLSGKSLEERATYLLEWLNLVKFKDRKSKHLSGGYRRLLNMGCSLMHDPKIIFMDEPTVGLDPKMRRIFWEKIMELKKQGKTIVLTTHYMDEAQILCDNLALMLEGQILVQGKPKELIQKFGAKDLEEVFLYLTTKKEELNV